MKVAREHKKTYDRVSNEKRDQVIEMVNSDNTLSFRQVSESLGVGYSNCRKIYKIYCEENRRTRRDTRRR